jgi:hypothetical protein
MGKYAKSIVAVLTAVVVALSTVVVADSTAGKVVAVVSAALGAIAVYAVPNKKPPAE